MEHVRDLLAATGGVLLCVVLYWLAFTHPTNEYERGLRAGRQDGRESEWSAISDAARSSTNLYKTSYNFYIVKPFEAAVP